MTPLQIEILLWYHCRGEDYDFSMPAVRQAIDDFKGTLRLLEPKPLVGDRSDFRTYQLTDRGQAYVNALMMLPLPVCQWVIPSPATTVTAHRPADVGSSNPNKEA